MIGKWRSSCSEALHPLSPANAELDFPVFQNRHNDLKEIEYKLQNRYCITLHLYYMYTIVDRQIKQISRIVFDVCFYKRIK